VMPRVDPRGAADADLMPCNSIDANSLSPPPVPPPATRGVVVVVVDVVSCRGQPFPQSLALSLATRRAAYNRGGHKNPIALRRNFEDTSWWRSACHKPDLSSGFVEFMRIGETVYGAWKEEMTAARGKRVGQRK